MDWTQLLSTKRVRELRGDGGSTGDHRTEFERDYDRIVFSSPIRRLKDKTQVFPLDPNDFVRTRLTHSLEVASVARGLVKAVANPTTKIDPHLAHDVRHEINSRIDDIQNIAATAALVHDLGNPPFGHFGEAAIGDWFQSDIGSNAIAPLADHPDLAADLLRFEGNARTTRLLASLQILADNHGLNLTAATLSASMKYVAASHEADKDGPDKSRAKPGFCQTEQPIVELVRDATGTGPSRNPIAYLVEAADDSVYSICDVEDGIRKGVITWRDFIEALEEDDLQEIARQAEDFIVNRARDSGLDLGTAAGEAYSVQFRVFAQGRAINAAASAFARNYDAIMSGTFQGELLNERGELPAERLIARCKKIGRERVYNKRPTVELELRGEIILHGLLDVLWRGVEAFDGKPPKPKSAQGKAYSLLSRNYRSLFEYSWKAPVPEGKDEEAWRHYLKLMLITDYVAGMTDGYAASLHKSLMNA